MPDISLPSVCFTHEQHVLPSSLKLLIAVRNGDFTLPYLSSYEIECLITNIAILKFHYDYYHCYDERCDAPYKCC